VKERGATKAISSARNEIAHGEARELVGALDCAAAWGYVVDASAARRKIDRLLGLLWGLTHSGRKIAARASAAGKA